MLVNGPSASKVAKVAMQIDFSPIDRCNHAGYIVNVRDFDRRPQFLITAENIPHLCEILMEKYALEVCFSSDSFVERSTINVTVLREEDICYSTPNGPRLFKRLLESSRNLQTIWNICLEVVSSMISWVLQNKKSRQSALENPEPLGRILEPFRELHSLRNVLITGNVSPEYAREIQESMEQDAPGILRDQFVRWLGDDSVQRYPHV